MSDLEVAAQYADLEIQSVAAQFANTSVGPARAAAPAGDGDDDSDSSDDDSDDEAEASKPPANAPTGPMSSSDDSSSDEEDDEKSTAELRAEIEAALEKEDTQASGPLTTPHEVTSVPVREPGVELTADCPIAECGSILNVSVPGLMITIKSLMNAKPLDEGSVLCLEDRTVLGCVDEVFGPVLMPMYLVRFQAAEKIPAAAVVNERVFFATEHTTYIVPESIKDKGTDASNLYDEETDEAVYSDDEAEAAAKRKNQNRKRTRGDRHAAPPASAPSPAAPPARGWTNYTTPGANRPSAAGVAEYTLGSQSFAYSGGVPIQVQPYGGQTKYTQPGPVAVGQPPRLAVPPAAYGATNYTSPRGYAPPPPPPAPYGAAPMYHQPQQMPSSRPMMNQQPYQNQPMPNQAPPYQGQQPAYRHPNLPPYPPPAPPPPAQYQHYPSQPAGGSYMRPVQPGYQQPPNARPPPGGAGYAPNGTQPPLPRGQYDDRRY